MGRFSSTRLSLDRVPAPAPEASATDDAKHPALTAIGRVGTKETIETVDLFTGVEGDFSGRPELAAELVPVMAARARNRSRTSAHILMRAMRTLWRALDDIELRTDTRIGHLSDFGRGHGGLVRDFVMDTTTAAQAPLVMTTIVSILSDACLDANRDPLPWPGIERAKTPQVHNPVDPAAVQFLKGTCGSVLANADQRLRNRTDVFRDGCLPQRGRDEHGRIRWSWDGGYAPENLFRLARRQFVDRIRGLGKTDIYAASYNPWSRAKKPTGITQTDALDACLPGFEETVAAYLLVALETGWIDAVPEIDVEGQWYLDITPDEPGRPSAKGTVAVLSRRGKTGTAVTAISLKGAKHGAFRVVQRQIKRTAFARRLLRRELRHLLRSTGSEPRGEDLTRIARLRRQIGSPWLYRSGGGSYGYAGVIDGANAAVEKRMRETLDQRLSATPEPADTDLAEAVRSLNISDLRDAYADRRYTESGGNIFEVQAGLGHRHVSSTVAYLRQRRQIAERFDQFRDATGIVLDEVSNGFHVDPTVLRLRLDRNYDEGQRRKLYANRTIMQMGCRAPTTPPSEIAPNHKEGNLCAVQRCTICRHGIFFPDAPEARAALVRRHAELKRLRGGMDVHRFAESTLLLELKTIEAMRDEFYSESASAFDEESDALLMRRTSS